MRGGGWWERVSRRRIPWGVRSRLHVPVPFILGNTAATELVRRRRVVVVRSEPLTKRAAFLAVVRDDLANIRCRSRVREEAAAPVHELPVRDAPAAKTCG